MIDDERIKREAMRKQLLSLLTVYRDPSKMPTGLHEKINEAMREEALKLESNFKTKQNEIRMAREDLKRLQMQNRIPASPREKKSRVETTGKRMILLGDD